MQSVIHIVELLETQKSDRIKQMVERGKEVGENSGINKRMTTASVTVFTLESDDTCPVCSMNRQGDTIIALGFHSRYTLICRECISESTIAKINNAIKPYNYRLDSIDSIRVALAEFRPG